MSEDVAIGKRIRRLRKAANMTQEQLCIAAGFSSRQLVEQLEKGNRSLKATEMIPLCNALGTDQAALFCDDFSLSALAGRLSGMSMNDWLVTYSTARKWELCRLFASLYLKETTDDTP